MNAIAHKIEPVECPLEATGRELGKLIDASKRAQDAGQHEKDQSKKRAFENVYERLIDRIFALEDSVAGMRAESTVGALVAMVHAYRLVSNIEDAQLNERERKQAFSQIKSLCYSAAAALCAIDPESYGAIGGEYYMPSYLNPFLALDDANAEMGCTLVGD